jgi:ketosteroid isomerase-like protein
MSQENVEAFNRAADASNRGDVEAFLEELDPEVEWHDVFQMMLGGEATVARGHEGIREFFRDTDEAFSEFQVEYSEIRDLGDRIVAVGRLRARGKESGATVESRGGWVFEFMNGKVVRAREYLDPKEALDAGLRE